MSTLDEHFKYTITKTFPHSNGLSAVFRQWRASSHCKYLHGYALQFEVTICCERLDENGWVFDYGEFQEFKHWLKTTFDHKLLVAESDPRKHTIESLYTMGLAQVRTLPEVGTEAFAKAAADKMAEIISKNPDLVTRGVHVISVTCREHESNAATYIDPVHPYPDPDDDEESDDE